MSRCFTPLLLLLLTLAACAKGPYDLDPAKLPFTGSEQTKEWIAYNEQAQKDDQPRLTYAVLCTELTGENKPKQIVSGFFDNDPTGYVYTKWDGVKPGAKYRIEWHDPRGVLHYKGEMIYLFSTGHWNTWTEIFIKNVAARLPGQWTLKLYMNDKLALTRIVPIGSTSDHSPQPGTVRQAKSAIAFRSLMTDGTAGPKYGWRIPAILSQRFSIDHPEFVNLHPNQTNQLIPLPENTPRESLRTAYFASPFVQTLGREHQAKLLVYGFADGSWTVGENNTLELYLLDLKTGQSRKLLVRYTLPPIQAGRSFNEWMIKVADKIYQDMMTEHGDFILSALGS